MRKSLERIGITAIAAGAGYIASCLQHGCHIRSVLENNNPNEWHNIPAVVEDVRFSLRINGETVEVKLDTDEDHQPQFRHLTSSK